MATLIDGLVGGLVATILMTAVMRVVGDGSPPPTAALWAKYVGDGPPEAFAPQGLVLHLLYGTVAGGVFVAAAPALGLGLDGVAGAALWGLIYGVVLFVVGAAVWLRGVLGLAPDRDDVVQFLVLHLVYGLGLGAVVGAGLVG